MAHPWNGLTLSDILEVRINTKLTGTEHVSEDRMRQLMYVVVSRPRPGLTLPLFVFILRHVHQSGHLIREVPRMIRCRSVQPGGYV